MCWLASSVSAPDLGFSVRVVILPSIPYAPRRNWIHSIEQALAIASLARQDDEVLGAHAREAVAQHADQHLALARIGHDRLDDGAHLVQLRRSRLVPLAAAVGQPVVKLEVGCERARLEVVDLVGEGKEQAVLVKRIDLVLVCGEVLQDQVRHVLVPPVAIGRKCSWLSFASTPRASHPPASSERR